MNKNFEQDLGVLQKTQEKINLLDEQKKELSLQLQEQCKIFEKKHSLEAPLEKVWGLEFWLKRGISAQQLVEIIQTNRIGLYASKLKNHITGKVLDNELLNYNQKILEELENKFASIDSIENCESLNRLHIGRIEVNEGKCNYLLNEQLTNILKNGHTITKSDRKNYEYIYMVVFNLIKKGDNAILIYNYIPYNKFFLSLLYVYVLIEQRLSLVLFSNKGYIGSDFFFILDKQLIDENPDLSRIEKFTLEDAKSIYGDISVKSLNSSSYNPIHVAKWWVDGNIKYMDFEDPNELLIFDHLYYHKIYRLLKSLGSGSRDKEVLIKKFVNVDLDIRKKKIFNLLSRYIFIVSDLDNFINLIKKQQDVEVNQGPQKDRGNISYTSYILSRIDKGFRDSMFNHNRSFIENIPNTMWNKDYYYIPKHCFSFKNIHINLGKIRRFSTANRFYYNTTKNQSNLILFKELKQILMDNPLNEDTQIKIEKSLIDRNVSKFNKDGLEFYEVISKLNKDLKNEFIRADLDLRSLINNFRERKIWKIYESKLKKLSKKELSLFYLSVILENVPVDFIISIMLGKVLTIINYHSQEKNNTAVIFIEMGKHLIDHYFYLLYKKEIKNNLEKSGSRFDKLKYSIRDWKIANKDLTDIFDNVITHGIGALLIDWLRDVNLLEISIEKSLQENKTVISVLKSTPKIEMYFKSSVTNKLLMLPKKIPMLVKPKEYKRSLIDNEYYEQLGGYLLNGEYYSNEIIIKNWRSKINSSIKDVNHIYRTINNISSIGYKINTDVLNFIRFNDEKLGLTNLNKLHLLEEKMLSGTKLSKWEKVEVESFRSKKFVEENVLGLADLFENIPEFYIPVRLDYRGRMYCESDYLNYQSIELAKSLLIFSKPSKILKSDINSINYLKIYGANCFGHKLDKKSFSDRVEWVNDNINNIKDFRNGILISKAESKLLFIAFCFEYNRWINCMDDSETTHFNTYLPIQLDASCNGYQHISMLVQDIDLAKHLNLTRSNINDVPNDFYTLISGYLTEYYRYIVKILESGKKDEELKLKNLGISEDDLDSFKRLISLDTQRNVIKRAIMTIPYNASSVQLIKYLQEPFEFDNEKTKLSGGGINHDLNEEDYLSEDRLEKKNPKNFNSNKPKKSIWYKNIQNPNIKLEERDFLNMYKGLMHILHYIFPSLNSLAKYFKDVTSICSRLGLSLPWYLPTGLIANQSYLEIKETKVKPLNFSNIEFRLNVLVPDKLDKYKQSRAFMPNLIHSLDATSLVLLIDKYFYEFNADTKNIYAIHDCFAVTINHMEYIMKTLKIVYISLYSNEGYLSKFDKDLIEYLKNHLGDGFNIDELMIELPSNTHPSKTLKIKYPDIKNVVKYTYNIQLVKESVYIIH